MPRKRTIAGEGHSHPAADQGRLQDASPAFDLAATIAEIRSWHRQRVFAMDQRKRSHNALGAFLRSQLGWSRAIPKTEAAAIAGAAADLIEKGEKIAKGKATGIGDPAFGQWGAVILASIQGRAHWDAIESAASKEMERLAASLPVWRSFGEGVRGFGARSLAVIIGEAGDLAAYANPGKLWKRMGLAVFDGVRQGGLLKTASKEEWIAHGYNRQRRSHMFVIGDVLVKTTGPYREVYLTRKQYERAKAAERGLTVAPAAKIPAKRKAEFISDGHIHHRAQRYMEKRLLRDLWKAWRAAVGMTSLKIVPSDLSAQADAVSRSTCDHHNPSADSKALASAQAERPTKMIMRRGAIKKLSDA